MHLAAACDRKIALSSPPVNNEKQTISSIADLFLLQEAGCKLDQSIVLSLLERHQEKILPSSPENEAAAPSQAEPETPSGLSSRQR